MSHVSTTVRIEAPAEAVFDVVADAARSPEWQTLLAELGPISGRPGGVGSSYLGSYAVGGRRLATRFVVTAAERPTLHPVDGTTMGGWARWTTLIEPAGDASNVHVTLEYELPGEIVGSLVGMMTGSRIEREVERTYAALKRLVEAGNGDRPPAAAVGQQLREPAAR